MCRIGGDLKLLRNLSWGICLYMNEREALRKTAKLQNPSATMWLPLHLYRTEPAITVLEAWTLKLNHQVNLRLEGRTLRCSAARRSAVPGNHISSDPQLIERAKIRSICGAKDDRAAC